jgi:hypothetical protein
VIHLLQHVAYLYLLVGLGWRCLLHRLGSRGSARSTVREWVASFAYGAGHLLNRLLRSLFAIALDAIPPERLSKHLGRVPDFSGRHQLQNVYTFCLLAPQFCALVKARLPQLYSPTSQLFPFLLH